MVVWLFVKHVNLVLSGSSLLMFLPYLTELNSCQWDEQGDIGLDMGQGWGEGEALDPHQCRSKDKYWLWTVLITSLNWAILLFPVGSLWKIHAGFHIEGEEQGWAWRTINHCRYIIHWKHVKRTRQDALDHWKQHFHRSFREISLFACVGLRNLFPCSKLSSKWCWLINVLSFRLFW